MVALSRFQRDLLSVIASQDDPFMSGIKDGVEDVTEGVVHHGRVHSELRPLVEAGLVERHQPDRRTTTYALTTRGRQALEDASELKLDAGGSLERSGSRPGE